MSVDHADRTTTPESPAEGADGAYYALYAECETQTDCHDYRSFLNTSPGPPGIGTVVPGTLRVRREGTDVALTWMGWAAPASYGIWSASTRAELAGGLAAFALTGVQDNEEGLRGDSEWRAAVDSFGSRVTFLRVAARDRCTDVPRE